VQEQCNRKPGVFFVPRRAWIVGTLLTPIELLRFWKHRVHNSGRGSSPAKTEQNPVDTVILCENAVGLDP